MPALVVKSIDSQGVCKVSKDLIDELTEIIQCPRDYFTIEVVESKYIYDGEIVKGPAVIDVFWFDRGQEVQDKTAKAITKHIKSLGYENLDVIFHLLEENKYYENGEHF